MAEIIGIANQKGGVGKTTTAINLSAALAHCGHETLLIDLDPQGNASSGLGFDKKTMEETIYQVLTMGLPIEKVIKNTGFEYLDAICANNNLIGAELELISAPSRELKLREALQRIDKMYHFIIIDCPPSLGLLTVNSMAAAEKVIVPIQSEYYALEGLANFIQTLNKVKETINPDLELEGILLTMYDARYTLAQQVRSEIEKHFAGKIFKTAIPRSIRLAEAPSFGQPIFQYDARSKGAEAYMELASEIMQRRGVSAIAPLKNPEEILP